MPEKGAWAFTALVDSQKRQTGEGDFQTWRSFQDKWRRNPQLAVGRTLNGESEIQQWILRRNGFKNLEKAGDALCRFSRILDAGCGNGRITALLARLAPRAKIVGVDITDMDIPRQNTEHFSNVSFQHADVTKNLSHLGGFDFIYCQEVLHHTKDPAGAFGNLSEILNISGIIAIYVYKKKAPTREFMDDHIRSHLSKLPYDDAMGFCRQISMLGKTLSEIPVDIDVPEIPLLGITAGKYPLQRFIYHFFLKCFWNPEFGDEENAVINYDWYHPQNCSRHTMDEVLTWFGKANLRITWKFEDHYGITVHGERVPPGHGRKRR